MARTMIDTDHSGLQRALPAINALPNGSIVAMYDTGSPDIMATPADWAQIHTGLVAVVIDQAFTGSPNLKANVRDCENGAWTLAKAVDKTGWEPEGGRPTLYLGFPDTAQQAFQLGWRGDIWIAMPSNTEPVNPPPVPEGLNVVAQQWNYTNPAFDVNKVFDSTWPGAKVVTPPPPPPAAAPPPGQWHNAAQFTWTECVIVGTNKADGLLYTFAYDPFTNLWLRQSLPHYERD